MIHHGITLQNGLDNRSERSAYCCRIPLNEYMHTNTYYLDWQTRKSPTMCRQDFR